MYVRFLPQDSAQFKKLMTDTTLTLFDFPLDYEIIQTGEYYHDPTVAGDYTWLYTRVSKDYVFPKDIRYEILEELFIMENSPYYSEEIVDETSILKAKSIYKTGMNDLLRTIEAIAFFNSGYQYGKIKDEIAQSGMQKLKVAIKKTFLWKTWYEYNYYPSGHINVKSSHAMNSKGKVTLNTTLNDVPVKGIKVHFWDGFFKWNSAYTDSAGYYESKINYNNDLYYDLYFMGKNENNSWSLDKVILGGLCVWVQKLSLGSGRESNNGYSTTIDASSGGWSACITNNAFYEYMTVCDNEKITRPDEELRVALRDATGSSSAPLLAHCMLLYKDEETTKGVFYMFWNSTTVTVTISDLTLDLLYASAPDILLSGGELTNTLSSIKQYYATVWHELTHAGNYKRVKDIMGYQYANIYWNDVIATEVGHSAATGGSDYYGIIGDYNWEQIALCEGWAHYIQRQMVNKYLTSSYKRYIFPWTYYNMYDDLISEGCSLTNIEKSLTAKTLSDFKANLKIMYPALSSKLDTIIK